MINWGPTRVLRLLVGKVGVGNLYDKAAAVYGGRTYLTCDEATLLTRKRVLSYRDFAMAAARAAGALEAAGVKPGQRVAVWMENGPDYLLYVLGAVRLGAVAVPLHHGLTAKEAEPLVTDAECAFCVTDRKPADTGSHLAGAELLPVRGSFGRLCEQVPPKEARRTALDDVAVVMFTSGTTGRAKGAKLTHRSLLAAARLNSLVPFGNRDTGVIGLPLAHVMGLATVLCAAYAGVHLRLFSTFRADEVMDAITEESATFFVGVPAMYGMMDAAGATDRDLSSIRLWISGADRMPPHLVERFRRLGASFRLPTGGRITDAAFCEVYGMVELSGPAIIKLYPPRTRPSRFDDVPEDSEERWALALPIFPHRVKVLNKEGDKAAVGEVGELWIRGPGVTRGYDNDQAAAKALVVDGWLRTGDLAVRDRFGRIRFAARKKDVIKHGGYSVFPAEVEAELMDFPGLAAVVVFGVPHPTKGQVPAAALIPEPGAAVDPRDVAAWSREHIASYRAPRALVVLAAEDLPRNRNGKVLKKKLLERVRPQLEADFPEALEVSPDRA